LKQRKITRFQKKTFDHVPFFTPKIANFTQSKHKNQAIAVLFSAL